MSSRNLIVHNFPCIFRRLTVPGCGFGKLFNIPSSDLSVAEAPLRMPKRWPLTGASLHQVTIGSRLASRAAVSNFGNCHASPNYSFKPNPLRGTACVPALRLHAFAATARVGLTQVLAPITMISATSFRDRYVSSLTVGYDWQTSKHFVEISLAAEGHVTQTFRIEGLSDYSISEDFGAQYISQCTFINIPGRVYLSLDPYIEGTEGERDNYTFVGSSIALL